MKKVVCIDDAGAEGITVNKIYEGFEEGFTIRIVNDFGEKAWYFVERFKEVPNKIRLLLQDKYSVIVKDKKYMINFIYNSVWVELNIFEYDNGSELLESIIRWKKGIKSDVTDKILDALNIEIVEPAPLYKIDVEGEYTAEQVAELEKLGIKIKRRRA